MRPLFVLCVPAILFAQGTYQEEAIQERVASAKRQTESFAAFYQEDPDTFPNVIAVTKGIKSDDLYLFNKMYWTKKLVDDLIETRQVEWCKLGFKKVLFVQPPMEGDKNPVFITDEKGNRIARITLFRGLKFVK